MAELAIKERLSPNHDARGEPPNMPPINMLVLHYTGMKSGAEAVDRLCDPEAKVSSHYVVEEDGTVWRLVPELQRAFHAGLSCWEGQPNLNGVSIGVEIVNPGHEWGYRAFPERQMQAVETLCREILSRHRIPSWRIVGHSDIAPDRKSDPGELFDWPRLARAGIGLWPSAPADLAGLRGRGVGLIEHTAALANLAAIGYCVASGSEAVALAAFQRRFRPERWDGLFDAETCARLAAVRQAVDAARAAVEAALPRRYDGLRH